MDETSVFTWATVQELWPIAEEMGEWLLRDANVNATECSFEQKGRWLIATSAQNGKWVWDDTAGEWLEEEEVDIDG